ncbi:hypothetical protein [uncultured Aquimarina sp.]|uniref:hypothetical protein n=1 Tax=uncultured Aquimarina sp. TaxID=575652 RepID=UPI00261F5201|nr:hypothetical protein [uncultured Aquimarina sp.]
MLTNRKKALPWFPTKSEVHRIFVKINRRNLVDEIQAVMTKHRNKPVEDVKNERILFHPEFIAIVKLFGIPEGYYASEGFFDEVG